MPHLLEFEFLKIGRFSFFANAGLNTSFRRGGVSPQKYAQFEILIDPTENKPETEFAWAGGGSLKLKIFKGLKFNAEGRFYRSFSPVSAEPAFEYFRFRGFLALVGLSYDFNI